MATTSLEDVATRTAAPLWFQLYVWRDRGLCRELVARAKAAGYRALVLTVDTPVPGSRERDLHNGLTIPPALTARTVLDGARHPRWWWGLLSGPPLTFANVRSTSHPTVVMEFAARQFDPTVTWDDIGWLAQAFDGPLVLKGVMAAEDACRAADAGAAAVVVSNHGGRQLDHAGATLPALERVADAVGDRLELYLDSGVRRGSDVVKALALGARAVLVGRPYLYGLAAGGQAGVERAIAILADELRRTLALLGTTAARDLDPSVLRRLPSQPPGRPTSPRSCP
jgi:L-lactate dehydrogenase (cytochrome)